MQKFKQLYYFWSTKNMNMKMTAPGICVQRNKPVNVTENEENLIQYLYC